MDMALDPRELLRIVWRRKWFFLIPATLAVAAAVVATAVLPPLYRSQATILIEHPDIPENVVPSLITERVDRRLEVITRRVLVADNLLRIADRHGLYAAEREVLSRGAIAARMRERIDTKTVVTEFNDPRTGRSGKATLAFQIRFADENPRLAREVTNDLVSAYLASNLESRRAVTEQTTSFLAGEREALDRRIATIEDELTDFKTANRELMPAEAAFKRQLLNNLEQRLRGLEGDLRVLRERESYLSTQLALIDEFDRSNLAGRGTTPESRLELLRAELATARARYSTGHPDVVRLAREVRSLEEVVGVRAGSSALAERESALSADLAGLRERYTDEHPDVARLRRELAAVRQAMADAGGGEAATAATAGVRRNNSYIQLSAQLNSVQAEIAAVEDQRVQLRDERVVLQEQLARAPAVEREYIRLQRRLENAIADREALADKEATARLSGSLETTAAGERLTLIEPPSTPGSPFSPNKKLILAIGLVLAVGSGGTALVLAELFDRSVRSVADLARLVGDTPLAAIPVIANPADRRRRWTRRVGATAAVVVVAGGGLAWVHQRVVPLDVLGYQAANQAERWVVTTFPELAGDGAAAGPR